MGNQPWSQFQNGIRERSIVLVGIVQFLYDVIQQVDYEIGQKRQIQANSDCQGHNGTDTNRPACVQVFILITF